MSEDKPPRHWTQRVRERELGKAYGCKCCPECHGDIPCGGAALTHCCYERPCVCDKASDAWLLDRLDKLTELAGPGATVCKRAAIRIRELLRERKVLAKAFAVAGWYCDHMDEVEGSCGSQATMATPSGNVYCYEHLPASERDNAVRLGDG